MEKVLGLVAAGEKEGGRRVFGAERVLSETGGYYVSPGVITDVTNDMSNFATPFGGFKQSGFGRDRSVHAIDKYCDYKTIWQQFG